MKKYTKMERQQLLRSILEAGEQGGQAHLLGRLAERGISTTQATVSRDLREMGYVRVTLGSGVVRYESIDHPAAGGLRERLGLLFETFVIAVCSTGNLLLVKTTPGNANGVASLIDALRRPGILGTVAGDDTILVVLDSAENCLEVEQEFKALR
jgi:transcriptional regulator of arginine metabolism